MNAISQKFDKFFFCRKVCNKTKMVDIKFLFVATLIIWLLVACSSRGAGKIVVYVSGCMDAEIVSDILHSKKGVEKFAKQNDISVEINDVQPKCGYHFLSNKGSKDVDGVLTDYDLMQEASLFFEN